MKQLDKKVKKMSVIDIGLVKWSVLAFTLFLVSVWPAFANWVVSVHWGWFLAAFVIFVIKPLKKFWF